MCGEGQRTACLLSLQTWSRGWLVARERKPYAPTKSHSMCSISGLIWCIWGQQVWCPTIDLLVRVAQSLRWWWQPFQTIMTFRLY